MARYMDSEASELFRAVITTTYVDSGHTFTNLPGPFIAKGPATTAIKKAEKAARRHNFNNSPYKYPLGDMKVEGYVERAQITWERIDG